MTVSERSSEHVSVPVSPGVSSTHLCSVGSLLINSSDTALWSSLLLLGGVWGSGLLSTSPGCSGMGRLGATKKPIKVPLGPSFYELTKASKG